MISSKGTKSKDSKFTIVSFCTVATKEVQREAFILINSIRRIYKDNPIVVVADEEASLYLDSKHLENVEIIRKDLKTPDSVIKRNKYHRADAILWKMDALDHAVRKYSNSIFLDADIILLEPLDGPSDCSLALSHNLNLHADIAKSAMMDGMFNAGMVWTNSIDFPSWWRNEYLRQGTFSFYEQGLLNRAPAAFRCGFFNLEHNYGFWRGDLGERRVRSFHCHMDDRLDATMPEFMMPKVKELRKGIMKRLINQYTDLHEVVSKVTSNEM